MPEDLKLLQIGSSQLPPPFRGLHSPRVRKHCQITIACYFQKSSILFKSDYWLLSLLACCAGNPVWAVLLVKTTQDHFSSLVRVSLARQRKQLWRSINAHLTFTGTANTNFKFNYEYTTIVNIKNPMSTTASPVQCSHRQQVKQPIITEFI